MKNWKVYLLVLGSSLGVIVLLFTWLAFGPARPLIISAATTNLTEPLTADGQVDYVAAMYQSRGPRIPPEQNQAIPVLQATWPAGLSPEHQQMLCDELQIDPPAESGWRSLDNATYQAEVRAWLNRDALDEGIDFVATDFHLAEPDVAFAAAGRAPWRAEQFPLLADWLDSQQEQLDQLHEIGERSDFYSPSIKLLDPKKVSWYDEFEVVSYMSPDASRHLLMRAMRSIAELHPNAAWRDIQTIYQLSDLRPKVPAHVELLFSIAVRGRAYRATWTLLSSGQCDAQLLAKIETFLAAQQPIPHVADTIDQNSRWEFLDIGQRICAGDKSGGQDLFGEDAPPAFSMLTSAPFDRNALMATLNGWYDQAAAAARLSNSLEAYQAAVSGAELPRGELDELAFSLALLSATINQRLRGEILGNLIAYNASPFAYELLGAEFRCNTELHLVRAGVVLEKYRLEQGEYPPSLKAVVDEENHSLLTDPFTGTLLQYYRRDNGFLLYSCFLNGVDNGGDQADGSIVDGQRVEVDPISSDDRYDECDLVVLMPDREFKLPQPRINQDFRQGE